jgi:hypothetical protein
MRHQRLPVVTPCRRLLALTFCALLLGAACAQPPPPTRSSSAAGYSSSSAGMPSTPSEISDPLLHDREGATAQCRDGTLVYERASTRMCAQHGGVALWLPGPRKDLIRP